MDIQENNIRLKKTNIKLKKLNAELEVNLIQQKIKQLKISRKLINSTIKFLELEVKRQTNDLLKNK